MHFCVDCYLYISESQIGLTKKNKEFSRSFFHQKNQFKELDNFLSMIFVLPISQIYKDTLRINK